MKLSNSQKVEQGKSALEQFTNQFGDNDIVKDILFDVLLEVIYGKSIGDDLPISSEEGQDDSKDTINPRDGEMPTYEIT